MNENIMDIDYDYKEDILFFYSKKQKYKFSEFLNKSIVMDFNENKIPMGLEILNASKLFKAKKHLLTNIKEGDMEIVISEKNIELNINLIIEIHQKSTPIAPINVVGNNNFNIPNIKTEVAVASL